MKTDYKAPEATQIDVEVERGFEASEQKWYQEGGSGDFGYGTETEDTWE
ncbi:MAG: hypothetical protein J6C56_08625 [Alistipes sp.]|nr:hypothetical protein [Alistipes sp.]